MMTTSEKKKFRENHRKYGYCRFNEYLKWTHDSFRNFCHGCFSFDKTKEGIIYWLDVSKKY